jgi:hypothetical protein
MTAGDILKLKLIQEAAEKVGRCSLTPGCPRVDLAWCQCIQRARPKHDHRLSNFASYINLRRYTMVEPAQLPTGNLRRTGRNCLVADMPFYKPGYGA